MKALGIINFSGNHIHVEGMQDYRPIAAFSFLGRYRAIDFPISNMSNSGIERIQVYVNKQPRSLAEHLGTGRHYNINSKRGRVQMLFSENGLENTLYDTDIAAYIENMECIEESTAPYVVVAPSYMIYTEDFNEFLKLHEESNADISLLYHTVDNAKEAYLNCDILNLTKQKGVLSIEKNRGTANNRNIFMDTYIMKRELFIDLVKKARKLSSMYTLPQIVNSHCEDLDIRGVSHRGYFAAITDLKSYYDANISLIDYHDAQTLFKENWPIYTRTNDSCPTQYYNSSSVKKSVVSNGCLIGGSIENSVIGRGCIIKEGAVVKNSVVLPDVVIEEGIHVENQVVDKHARVLHVKEIVGTPDQPGYIRRNDIV